MSRLDKNKNGQDVEVNRRKSIAVVFAEVSKERNAPEKAVEDISRIVSEFFL